MVRGKDGREHTCQIVQLVPEKLGTDRIVDLNFPLYIRLLQLHSSCDNQVNTTLTPQSTSARLSPTRTIRDKSRGERPNCLDPMVMSIQTKSHRSEVCLGNLIEGLPATASSATLFNCTAEEGRNQRTAMLGS